MSFTDFAVSKLVLHLHNIPRFGHSNHIAHMADDPTSYKHGILAFCAFLLCLCLCWVLHIVMFKCYHGVDSVGCAAGGSVVDIKSLKRHEKLSKRQRKERIIRNWRVQAVCLAAAVCFLPLSILLLQLGLDVFVDSLSDIRGINDLVDSRAYRGVQIVNQLMEAYENLRGLERSGLLKEAFDVTAICPKPFRQEKQLLEGNDGNNQTIDLNTSNITNTTTINSSATNNTNMTLFHNTFDVNSLLGLSKEEIQKSLGYGLTRVETLIQKYSISQAEENLYHVTNATDTVDVAVDKIYSHDWFLRLCVVLLDVTVIFWIIGILIAKHNTDWPAFQSFASWILIPMFCVLLQAVFAYLMFILAVAIINGDFCAGTPEIRSPVGTLKEFLELVGQDENSISFQALQYYEMDCLSFNPLGFLSDIEETVTETHVEVEDLYYTLNRQSLFNLDEVCGNDNKIHEVNSTLHLLESNLSNLRGTFVATLELTGCSSISPIFRRLYFGSVCTQSVEGLTWLFWTAITMTVLGLIMLTTRAALFNPVIRGRRRKRREKEFEDYKDFMSRFYDTSKWHLDWIPDVKDLVLADETPRDERFYSESGSSTFPASASDETDPDDEVYIEDGAVASQQKSYSDPRTPGPTPSRVDDRYTEYNGNGDNYDDDDDSYDSTYSSDSDESDVESAMSILSNYFRSGHTCTAVGEIGPDELLSSSSSSTLFSPFFRRRTPAAYWKRRNVLSPYGERQENEDDNDSDSNDAVMTMMTPQPIRYPPRWPTSSARKRCQEDPEDFEMIPLTPPPRPLLSRHKTPSKIVKALSRRSAYE